MANIICPFFSKSKVSKLKVEKVLKPPQNPVSIKSFQVELNINLSGKTYIKIPKMIAESKLEKKVAYAMPGAK